jgi:hypothetical protein
MMNHKNLMAVCGILAILYCTPAGAVLYKYTDSKGIVHITDKIATIPAKYKPQIVKDEKASGGKAQKSAAPASKLSPSDQPEPSSEFQPAPVATQEVEKPVVSEFSLTTPQGKDVVEAPVVSTEFQAPEKPPETQPAPVAVKEPETPAASEFSAPVAQEKTEPETPVVSTEFKTPEKPPETQPAPVAVKEPETPALKPSISAKTSETVETGYIGGADESIEQASIAPSRQSIQSKPEIPVKTPPAAQPETPAEKPSLRPEQTGAALPVETSSQRSKDMDLAKLIERRTILADKKEALNKEFDTLMKERQRLDAGKNNLKDPASIDQYNQDVKELNEKIKRYKEKERALKEEIEHYNEAIERSSKR